MPSREQELVEALMNLDNAVASLEEQLQERKRERDRKEAELLELMEAEGKESTARYEGIGFATLAKPELYASFQKENEPLVFGFLRDTGRDELIKETVHKSSLSSYVKELVEAGGVIPNFINYYLKRKVKLYRR